ncbi:MAG TPA: alginate export family protein [Rariglobus sp.]|jgi:hypothetical protein|nr:alginate export family protein [Rariglobus sp.]
MKDHLQRLLLLTALSTAAIAAETPKAPATFLDSLIEGKPVIDVRIRFEQVQQDALKTADAITARTRLGYGTAPYKGFQAYIEGENIEPLEKNYFDGTGTNGSKYATVADPEITHINQAWLAYTYEKTKATLGRQKIIYDNARFIGDVGWRQNDQTFDAFSIKDTTFKKLTLNYAYLERINRVFDDSGAQPDYHSNSHLVNVSYAGVPFGTLTAYAYLLDFKAHDGTPAAQTAARNNSTQTYGLSYVGAYPVGKEFKATYRLEYATQSEYGNSLVHYNADYYTAELGGATKNYSLAAGYEVLGSDSGQGFRTPLATLHAFDGWDDVFLVTPATGLTDTYIKATAKIPGPVALTAFYHFFGTDRGASDLGQEADIAAVYKLNKQISFLAKFGKYWSDQNGPKATAGNADVQKFWLEADYKF